MGLAVKLTAGLVLLCVSFALTLLFAQRAQNLSDEVTRDHNGVTAAVLLVVSVSLSFVFIRGIVRSVRSLRDAVVDLLDNEFGSGFFDAEDQTAAEMIRMSDGDELRQVGGLLELVRDHAFQLIENERTVRKANIGVLVSLSRRCQTLIGKQLGILEQWERGEVAQADLENLFKLDHLATRMRRINENLVLLSGEEASSRARKPATVLEVLQAAVAEIDQYARVYLGKPPAVKITAGLVKDLVRLLAELLENAATSSPPDVEVEVNCRILTDGSLSVSVLDFGIGMTDATAEQANARLTRVGTLDLIGARNLGLFVVGRIAGRHGLAVALHAGTGVTGVRAMVTVPASYIRDEDGQEPQPLPLRVPGATEGLTIGQPDLSEPAPPRNAVTGPQARRPVARQLASSASASRRNGRAGLQPRPRPGERKSPFFTPVPVMPRGDVHEDDPDAAPRTEPRPGWFARGLQRGQGRSKEDWSSPADSEWKIVETVSQLKPERFDENGLPQRVSGEFLMPGSIGGDEFVDDLSDFDRPAPEALRRRLRAFRAGLTLQRPSGDTQVAAPADTRLPQRQEGEALPSWMRIEEPAWRSSNGKPVARELRGSTARGGKTENGNGNGRFERPRNGSLTPKESSEWTMLSDNGWQQARHVAQIKEEIVPETGLPQRVRGAHLVPGSARTTLPVDPGAPRDPEQVRMRIGNFRRGLATARVEQI
jgi:signal transduction histidine kinase